MLLLSSRGRQSQKLGEHKQLLLELLLGRIACLLLNRLHLGLELLVVLLGQLILDALDFGLSVGLVLLVELLVLGDLLLKLCQRRLECWLLQDLCLLIGVDLAGSNELVEALAWVLLQNVIHLRCVCLAIC